MATPDQEQALAQFQAVTTCESTDTARFYLESSAWDIELAVGNYFATGGVPAAAEAPMDEAADEAGEEPATTSRPAFTVSGDPEEEDQRWYTGGHSSGQEVIAPPKPGRKNADDVFSAAKRMGATEGTSDDLEPPAGPFQGGARTLSGGVVKSKTVSNVAIRFYANDVFTVNHGPPRECHAPENQAFMQAIARGECPDELSATEVTDVSLMKMEANYEEPEKPKYTSFAGSANKLGAADGASTSAAAAPPAGAAPAEPWSEPDASLPLTSLQLRLSDGSRMVAKFNHTALVSDIRRFVASARADYTTAYAMMTGFPAAAIKDETATLQEAGLLNAVIILK